MYSITLILLIGLYSSNVLCNNYFDINGTIQTIWTVKENYVPCYDALFYRNETPVWIKVNRKIKVDRRYYYNNSDQYTFRCNYNENSYSYWLIVDDENNLVKSTFYNVSQLANITMTKELNDTSLYCMEFLKNNTVCILRSYIKLYYIPHEDDEHTQAGTYQSTHILTVCLVVVVITLVALLIVIFFLAYKKKQRDPQPLPAEATHYSVVYDHWIRQRHCQ